MGKAFFATPRKGRSSPLGTLLVLLPLPGRGQPRLWHSTGTIPTLPLLGGCCGGPLHLRACLPVCLSLYLQVLILPCIWAAWQVCRGCCCCCSWPVSLSGLFAVWACCSSTQ